MSEKEILDPWIKLASVLASTSGAMGITRFEVIYKAGPVKEQDKISGFIPFSAWFL